MTATVSNTAEVRADEVSRCYTVEGLAARLECHPNTAYLLITGGKIAYFRVGKKGYRVSERAVRRYEDGLPPALPLAA